VTEHSELAWHHADIVRRLVEGPARSIERFPETANAGVPQPDPHVIEQTGGKRPSRRLVEHTCKNGHATRGKLQPQSRAAADAHDDRAVADLRERGHLGVEVPAGRPVGTHDIEIREVGGDIPPHA